ncbi:ComEC/Rec2 family competence protein [Prauserella halophila]|uniref:ComEC/Rec2 family competence protein n=1 Tax=Prauserella halophila TaxID=185641 RepID=A0ABN1WB13_9PSEU|nr:ComEC/Rec2 family competence protein [Prauserella halophila]MCP2234726.1 competence protein ComEC [Prauserella halophila]
MTLTAGIGAASEATAEPAARPRRDLRLVPAALAVWGGALAGLQWGWQAAVAVGAVSVVAGVLAGVHARRRRSVGVAAAATALGVCGVLVLAPLSVRVHAVGEDPLRAVAADGGDVRMRAEVRERPRPLRDDGYGGRRGGIRSVLVPVDVVSIGNGDRDTGAGAVAGAPSGGTDGSISSTGRVLLIGPAGEWAGLLPGQQVSAAVSLAPARPGDMTVAVGYVRGPPEQVGAPSWWQRSADMVRTALRDVSGVLGDEEAGLLPGLVVGDTGGQSPRVEEEFLDAGLSHLTAVSGSNVAIVCGAVLLLARAVRVGPRVSAGAAGLALAGFVMLVGYEPSVLRAAVMGALGLAALVLGRRRSAVPALAVAVCGLILADPAMATSMGFALSVVATAGLIFLAPRWAAALAARRVPPGIAEALAVPVAAFVATAPVIAGMAGEVSVVSVAANLLAAPVVAPITVLGVAAAALAVPSPAAAEVLVHFAGPGVSWLVFVAREAAAVPGAVVSWPAGWWGGLGAAGVAVGAVAALRYRKARVAVAVAVTGTLVVTVPPRLIAPAWPPVGWAVVACDVGQGDGIVLATGKPGRAVVVDAGPDPRAIDRCLDRLAVERIPLLVLSHLHADHVGGLSAVFDGRTVGAVGVGQGRTPSWAWRAVLDEARANRVPVVELTVGEQVRWDELTLDVLGPHYVAPAAREEVGDGTEHAESSADGTAINDASVVVRASTPAGRVLLAGDVELAAQSDLLARGASVEAEILKVPHHGSRHTHHEFLTAVRARIALVSVGADNTHGHPNDEIMRVLRGDGALITRTDEGGDIAIVPGPEDDGAGGPHVVRRGPDRR